MKIVKSAKLNSSSLVLFFESSKRKVLANSTLPKSLEDQVNTVLASLPKTEKTEFFNTNIVVDRKAVEVLLVSTNLKGEWAFKLGASLGKTLIASKKTEVSIVYPDSLDFKKNSRSFVEGLFLGSYNFEHYFSKADKKSKLTKIEITGAITSADLEYAENIFAGVKLARDISNLGGNDFTPTHFKKIAERLSADFKFKLKVIDSAQMKKLGMGCFYGVTQGSSQPAFLNILEYSPKKYKKTLMLVGKGLTFDSGGISIKPSKSMEEMKFDMCGGAAVMGAMEIVGRLKPDTRVIALVPTSENLINGSALKPGDIVTAYNGLSVEIINTDAEGRLILCDSLSYGIKEFKPDAVIDLATLTGAIVGALGNLYTGSFTNDDKFYAQVEAAGKKANEQLWPMPLNDIYLDELKSDYADIKNSHMSFGAGASIAAIYLKQFIGDVPWVHLDIAGTAWNVKSVEHYPSRGATGVGVRLLYNLIENFK